MSSCYALDEEDRHASFLVESNRYLSERGVEVSVFAPSYHGLRSHTVNGVEVRRFRYFPRRWENLTHMEGAPTRVRNPLYLLVAALYIVSGLVQSVWYCYRKKFDIIHVHWPFPHAIWGYAASRATGAPMVLTFHGAEILLCKKFFFVKYFLRHAIRHADAVICNSSFTAERVRELGIDTPIEIIPFGTTIAERHAPKDPQKRVKDILFSGRLIERKGVDHLLRAIPAILQQTPAHVHIVGIGAIRPQLEQLASELGIAKHVTFHGFVSNEELSDFYAKADVFVLPAVIDAHGDTEGLGVVLIEAITHMTPVVASNVGGIVDIIKHEQTGLLVPQRDADELAAAIIRLINDAPLREKIVEQGLRHVREYLDWQSITDRLMAVYTRVAHPKGITHPASVRIHVTDEIETTNRSSSDSIAESIPPEPLKPLWGKLAFRLIMSVVILAALFTQISIHDVVDNLRRVSLGFVLFAWCYYALCQWISAYRWQVLLRAKDVHVPLSELFSFYMIGMFINNFMPGSIGGDVAKSYYLFKRTRKLEITVVSVFLERFTGLLGLCLLAVIALAVGYQYLHSPMVIASVVGSAVILVLIVVVLWQLPNLAAKIPLVSRIVPQRIRESASELYTALASYRHHVPTLFVAIAISTILQLMLAAYYAIASIAMGIPISLVYFLLFLPAVTLVSLIPLSLGGLGIRETAMVVLFGAAGISQPDVMAVSLTIHIINTILSLWGGILLLQGRKSSKQLFSRSSRTLLPPINKEGS
ncbi:MAG TPA: flippase-like domain-containing protein [Lacipirellulaceae bacterium]|nr:flippase-like domain-containing protein [Lacipirellulaceae bacterium]